jgi:nucleoid-associated protein YgaU
MNEHAGPACALSGLIVGIFAVLLHDNTPPPPVPVTPVQVAPATSPPGGGSSKPEIPSTIRQTPSGAIAAAPPRAEEPASALPTVQTREIPAAVSESSRFPTTEVRHRQAKTKSPNQVPKKPTPVTPRPAFAIVEQGETLAQVAVRVYGSNDATEALWQANRDQVERVDSPLARGTLLRVP